MLSWNRRVSEGGIDRKIAIYGKRSCIKSIGEITTWRGKKKRKREYRHRKGH